MSAGGADRRVDDDAPAAGVPAKRQAGRQVVVLLGAAPPGLALLARALQALGADMIEPVDGAEDPRQHDWRRPWIADLNSRMLSAIGREPEHFAHALPFPPGWWRRPQIQALKREAIGALEAALDEHEELWGFADVATARLLPVWEDVFERLGLTPVYVWSLAHPAKVAVAPGPDATQAAAAAEVRWFAYGADIYRYGAEHLACVVDEGDWRTDPQGLMESLVSRLRLRWRGTRLDLYETVAAVLAEGADAFGEEASPRPAALPLSMSFYRSAQALGQDGDEDARHRLATMVESAELLRPLIAPFLPVLQAADEQDDPAMLRQEIAALRETCAGLKRLSQAPQPPQDAPDERLAALELELEARRAEIRWLHDRHAADLHDAEVEIEALKAAAASGPPADHPSPMPPGGATASTDLRDAQAEVARLQAEMTTLTTANERYLARIYELKKALEDHGAFERAGR